MGRELFDWDAKQALSGQRNGSKVTGVGVAISLLLPPAAPAMTGCS